MSYPTKKPKYAQIARLLPHKNSFLVSSLSTERNILELFCATGENWVMFKEARADSSNHCFIGVDMDISALAVAQKNGVRAVAADVHRLPFLDNSIDAIYCNSLHHTPDSAGQVVAEAMRVLKPLGVFIGVESWGLLARWALWIILRIPAWIRNRSTYLREIHNERNLLEAWHTLKPLNSILDSYPTMKKRRFLFWIYYTIKKEHPYNG
ncbi:MAG: class I SAM-dependent methyltransferase [Elusimicrobia bacterium]|nr:class I SAM-dependent methyltransferase [Elusimicrobiota bacterium]